MPPIALTEEQFNAISAAAVPIAVDRRPAFLADVASALASMPEVGDGALHRVVMIMQRKYFSPPILDDHNRRTGIGKYA